MKRFATISLSLFAFFLFSCKNSTSQTETDNSETSMPLDSKGPVKSIKLTKDWETATSLTTSESVLFDEKNGNYLVSCIGNVPPNKEDGDGYIAVIDQRGNILKDRWVTGLDAPKGMGLKDGKIYVTDINDFVIIDKATASIEKRISVPGATFLNDVAIAPDGKVYFTDSDKNTVYFYDGNKVQLFKKDDSLGGTNGIHVDHETIYLAGFGSGDVHTIDIASKEITKHASGAVPGGDGVEPYEGGFIYSNWNGEVYFLDALWNATKVLDTKGAKANAADIEVNLKTNQVLVPTFFDNRVVAYSIEKIYE